MKIKNVLLVSIAALVALRFFNKKRVVAAAGPYNITANTGI